MRVVFSEFAARDVLVADEWWRANRDSVEVFGEELDEAVAVLEVAARVGQRVKRGDRETRRLVLKRSRYLVFYEVLAEEVVILRVWHPAQAPRDEIP